MRRIFTSTIFAIALSVVSFNSIAQGTCSAPTLNPNPSPGFGATYNGTTGEGFTGTASPINVFPVSQTNSITSPGRFYFNAPQNTVYFRVTLNPNGNKNVVVNSYTIALKYGGGTGVTQSCTGTSFTIPNAGQTYYFTLSNISLPASTAFQITLTLDVANPNGTTSNVALSNIALNGLERAGAALPVKFSSLDARMANNSVSLKWNVATEDNVNGYEIERSADGRNYSKIGFVNADGEGSYSFVDTKALSIAYYRIKSLDVNGKYGYSTVAMVKAGKAMIVIKAFPTPFIKNVSIQHPTAVAGSAISISSEDGRIVKTIVPAIGTQQTDVDLSSSKAGLYLVRYTSGSGETETLKILKQQ